MFALFTTVSWQTASATGVSSAPSATTFMFRSIDAAGGGFWYLEFVVSDDCERPIAKEEKAEQQKVRPDRESTIAKQLPRPFSFLSLPVSPPNRPLGSGYRPLRQVVDHEGRSYPTPQCAFPSLRPYHLRGARDADGRRAGPEVARMLVHRQPKRRGSIGI